MVFSTQNEDILLSDTNVIFLPLGCGFFFSRWSISSADNMEEGKDVWMSNPYVVNSSEVAAAFNLWKQTSTQGSRNISLLQIYASNTVKE